MHQLFISYLQKKDVDILNEQAFITVSHWHYVKLFITINRYYKPNLDLIGLIDYE